MVTNGKATKEHLDRGFNMVSTRQMLQWDNAEVFEKLNAIVASRNVPEWYTFAGLINATHLVCMETEECHKKILTELWHTSHSFHRVFRHKQHTQQFCDHQLKILVSLQDCSALGCYPAEACWQHALCRSKLQWWPCIEVPTSLGQTFTQKLGTAAWKKWCLSNLSKLHKRTIQYSPFSGQGFLFLHTTTWGCHGQMFWICAYNGHGFKHIKSAPEG